MVVLGVSNNCEKSSDDIFSDIFIKLFSRSPKHYIAYCFDSVSGPTSAILTISYSIFKLA